MSMTRINDKDPMYWCRKMIQSIIVYENAHTVDEVLNGKSGKRYFNMSKQLLGEDTVLEMIQMELDAISTLNG